MYLVVLTQKIFFHQGSAARLCPSSKTATYKKTSRTAWHSLSLTYS